MQRSVGIIAIGISIIVSFLFSISADMEGASLGALINFFWPPIIGILTLLFYLLIWWVIKDNTGRIAFTVVLCAYNIYVGIALFLGKDYLPMVLF